MPRKQPPYVHREPSRHGRVVFYFRRAHGPRIRLPHLGTDDFDAAYRAALAGETTAPIKSKTRAGTLSWLITQYRVSPAYLALSPATRRQRDNIFLHVIEAGGTEPYKLITRNVIVKSRDLRTATGGRHFVNAMRGLFNWAHDSDFVDENPTADVKPPKQRTGEGFTAWALEDLAAYERRWQEGTKERVWLHVLLYTGFRRGDAVRIGAQHVRDGVATLKTEKTATEVSIPLREELVRTLTIGPTGDLAWICGTRGQPLTKESFGNAFRDACNAAGLKGKSAHGVRKIGATLAAEAGLTVPELEALFGWTGGNMASLYTRTANRKALAMQGTQKLVAARKREGTVNR
jgi:integrase